MKKNGVFKKIIINLFKINLIRIYQKSKLNFEKYFGSIIFFMNIMINFFNQIFQGNHMELNKNF